MRRILLADWNKIARDIRDRDNHICQYCGIHEAGLNSALHVHHKDYNPINNNYDNLISLCADCHSKSHGITSAGDYVTGIKKGDKRGSETIKRIYGEDYYKQIGRKGGQNLWKKIKSGKLNNPL